MPPKPLPDQIADLTSWLRQQANHMTRDFELAKDLACDTQIKALTKLGKFKEGTNLKGWLGMILRNTFINDYRDKAKYGKMATTSDALYDVTAYGLMSCHYNEADAAIGVDLIEKAIGSLPEKRAAIIRLRVEGYDYQEIADQLSLPLGTVKNNIFRARVELNDYIQKPRHDVLASTNVNSPT